MRSHRLLIAILVLALCVTALPPFQHSKAAPVEISFWHAMTATNQQVLTKLVEEFNSKNPDIKVIEQNKGASYNDALNAVIAAAQQKQAPNIAQIFDLGTPLAIDSGFFVPIQDLLSADQLKTVKDEVAAPVLDYFTLGGKLYSLPWNNSTPLLYYNKDMFKAAGLDPEKAPATWQDVDAACKKIMDSKAAPNCISLALYGWFFEQWMALQGAELANNGNGRKERATEVNLTSDGSKAIFTWWKSLADNKYAISTGKVEDTAGARQIFGAKQAAILIESTAQVGSMTKVSGEAGFALGTGWLPYNGKVERVGTIIGGASLWASAGKPDDQNKATVKFLTWLLSPEAMTTWHQGSGYMPITKGAQKLLESQGYFTKNPNWKVAVDQLNAAKSTSATAGAIMGPFPQIRTQIVGQVLQAITSGGSVDDSLKEAKTKADAAIADYNSRLKK